MAQTVVGFFKSDSAAQSAADRLQTAGFNETDIDVSDGSGYTDSTGGEKKADNAITRFFKNLFGDNDDADHYATAGNRGYSIVTVHASSGEEAQRAAALLDEYGAVELDDREHAYSSTDDSGATIQRVEEQLQVGKQEVAAGGVRLRSRIVDKPVEETLRLRRERVTVERQAVNRPLTDSDRTDGKSRSACGQ
jgi:stress response protein YsnF